MTLRLANFAQLSSVLGLQLDRTLSMGFSEGRVKALGPHVLLCRDGVCWGDAGHREVIDHAL